MLSFAAKTLRRRVRNGGAVSRSVEDPELKLPKTASLVIIILANVMLQISFFIIVASSNEYAQHLGGTSTFSGVVLGIPTVFSGLVLLPLLKLDRGGYKIPLHVSCGSSILGLVLYSCAYHANYLYLILIGRIVSGFGFSMFMYCKRFCSDPRLVGIRRRTTLASWLVIGQGVGMSLGPFIGGLLYKVGFKNSIFNGFTSPGWILAGMWCLFWVAVTLWFEDVPEEMPSSEIELVEKPEIENGQTTVLPSSTNQPLEGVLQRQGTHVSASIVEVPRDSSAQPLPRRKNPVLSFLPVAMHEMTISQWGVLVCMCWFAMLCFFILGAWEANLPVFGAEYPVFHWSPFSAGNFIALGGAAAFPFLILNLFLARRVQDRKILAFGTGLGVAALTVFLILLRTDKINYASAFMCWWAIALGFNVATTVTMSLLSKQMPPSWNSWTSLAIQYSNYTGRVTGAVWGGSGVKVGMMNYVGLEIAFVGVGATLFMLFWKDLKAKTG